MDAIAEQHLSRLAKTLADARREAQAAAMSARANPFNASEEPGVLDASVLVPVKTASFTASRDFRVSAVDGGIISKELHGSALAVAKAVAVEFTYTPDGKLAGKNGVRYSPSRAPPLMVGSEYALDSSEMHWFSSLFRLKLELQCALHAVKAWKPDLLLLDGSIVPQAADKPRESSVLEETYGEIVESFKALYEESKANGVTLVGVNKDSRGKQFISYLPKVVSGLTQYRSRLDRLGDSVFLSEMLKAGERSFAFSYSQATDINPVMRDLGPWSKSIASYYLKAVPHDRPVRVDLLLPELLTGQKGAARAKIDATASWLSRLCAINPKYAYPAALIEADLRAVMRFDEFERVFQQLKQTAGNNSPFFFELRRNSRPFR